MTDLYPVPDITDEDPDFPPQPDALPSLQHLMDTYRPTPHPARQLSTYTYLGVSYSLDEDDIQAAERAFQDHMEACEEFEMDGCDPPAPYCGCSDCYSRATAGFWISYVMASIRNGRASVQDPNTENQLKLPLEPTP